MICANCFHDADDHELDNDSNIICLEKEQSIFYIGDIEHGASNWVNCECTQFVENGDEND